MAEVFPSIFGKNLNKEGMTIPDDFSDKNLFVIVAFQKWHQPLVDEMIEILEECNVQNSYHILEVPVIQKLSWFRQMRLDTLMRVAIKDSNIRQRTITVYLDKKEFRDKLDIPHEDTIYWFLVDHISKRIYMRGSGVISPNEANNIIS
jgi:hypothetical protein